MGVVLDATSWLIHVLLEAVLCLLVWAATVWRIVRRVFRLCAPRKEIDAAAVRAASSQIRHVAAVLPNDKVSVEDVALLCQLLLASSAEWITVYQEHGNLKRCQQEIRSKLLGVSVARLHYLDESDSAGGLLRAVEDVGSLPADLITAKEISSRLPVQCPDVDLALCFDGPRRNGLFRFFLFVCCFFGLFVAHFLVFQGLLPWNIRLTTFIECEPLNLFTCESFLDKLAQFRQVQQRHGA